MKNPTNGDSIELKIMNFIEANNKIQAVEANRTVMDMSVIEQLKGKEIPYISLKVMSKSANKGIENDK